MSNLCSASNRSKVTLDGEWQFSHETVGKLRQILVPMPCQAQFDDLRQSFGTATYRRAFAGPAVRSDQVLVLHFGAVSYFATVQLNGQQIGTHEGGYLPFECVVPPELINKTNVLEVTAVLPDANFTAHPDFPFAEILHGKQSWYGPISGIWQSVQLVVRNRCSLQSCAISPDLTSGKVQFSIALSEAGEIGIEIFDMNGDLVANGRGLTGQPADISIPVANPAAWSPDHPALYRAPITVTHHGNADFTDHSFGFRSFATRDGKLFLSGAEFYLRGALDQDYYPLGICTPWGDGVAYPHGVQNRFATFQLGSVFASFEAFIAAEQWYQFANLKCEIEVMRAEAAIQVYVITEFTDVHWESSGLLDMNRNTRVFHDLFATINADAVIVPKVTDCFGIAGKTFGFDVAVATGAVRLAAGHRLHWEIAGGATGALEVANSETGAVIDWDLSR